MLGRPIGQKWRQNREGNLDARIADPAPQAQDQPANSDAPDDFAGDDCRKRRCGFAKGKDPRAHGNDRETV